MIKSSSLSAVLSLVWVTSAFSGVCDYRLSQLVNPTAATAVVTAGGAGATVGPATMALGGLYFFPHATSGLMLGSTLAGASGAGTVGIIGGSGFAAGALATLTAPITLLVAAGTAFTVGGVEAGCYFVDERITEEEEVFAILKQAALSSNEDNFKLIEAGYRYMAMEVETVSRVRIPDEDGTFQFYEVKNLYIVNGELWHRDWLKNTPLGNIAAALVAQP